MKTSAPSELSSPRVAWLARFERAPGVRARVADLSGFSPRRDGTVMLPHGFASGEEVLIGFSPDQYDPFLVAGGAEYAAGKPFRPVRRQDAHPRSVRAAVFLRLRGVSSERRARLERWIRDLPEGSHARSGGDAVLEALRAGAGIVPATNLRRGSRHFRLPVFRSLVSGGLRTEGGEYLGIEVYKTRPLPLHRIFRQMLGHDVRHAVATALSALFSRK